MTVEKQAIGMLLILAGLVILALGLVTPTQTLGSSGSFVLLIGPIPLGAAFGPYGAALMILSLALSLMLIALLLGAKRWG